MIKKRILIIGLVILFIIFIYQVFLKEKELDFDLIEVVQGNVKQEIFETGQIGKGEKVNLAFKNSGTIEAIYVKAGDEIQQGQELAKLDTTDLEIQLQGARISLELAQLNLNKLLAGSSPEEIKIVQSQVESAQISLNVAQDNLKDSYEEAVAVLDGSYPYIYNALSFVKDFIGEYVTVYNTDGREIMNARGKIESAEGDASFYLEIAKTDSTEQNIETAILNMRSSLERTFNNLETIRGIIDESAIYQSKVSSTDRTFLNSHKTDVNTALTGVIGSQQTISSMKSSLQAAETSLQETENRLASVTATSRQVDVDLYQAQIRQAESKVQSCQNQLLQSRLISPLSGKIAEIKKRVGELAQSALQDAVMIILPEIPYEIKVNIYEEDVVKVAIGNPVDITLVAFPGQTFSGRVVLISPAEKIVDGVVYYETTIGFGEVPGEIKPGMSADIIIKTNSKDNVLIVPEEAITADGNRNFVEVYANGKAEERDIQIGLKGNDDMVEVISGLEIGEKVILR